MMKKRNPIFVVGFPYLLMFIGYIFVYILQFVFATKNNNLSGAGISTAALVAMLIGLVLIMVGVIYTIYWQISTARSLRAATNLEIPNSILLFIPIASYWWMWKYGVAAESYTKGKMQGILAFILLALLGSIGNGILQDSYNKVAGPTDTGAPQGPADPPYPQTPPAPEQTPPTPIS